MKAKVEIHNGNNGRSERKRNTMKTSQEEIKKERRKGDTRRDSDECVFHF